jgi:alanyl-tRNA synthetase
LLQAALRQVLGNHVEQAGQSVTPEHVRFDFTHFAAMTKEELSKVEFIVNNSIWRAIPVQTEVLPIEEAKARGAMALFGEKYGDTVRMVSIGDVSKELCGGTHAANTGNLGAFLITGEGSVASGVRRIEAVTRDGVAAHYQAQRQELQERNEALLKQIKEKDKQLDRLGQKLSGYAVRELMDNAQETNGVKFACGEVSGDVRRACDIAKQGDGPVVALFACKTDKGLQFAAACSPGAVRAGAHAGNLVRAAAQAAGGSGGGKPDSAMAGGRDASKLGEALQAGKAALEGMVKQKN